MKRRGRFEIVVARKIAGQERLSLSLIEYRIYLDLLDALVVPRCALV